MIKMPIGNGPDYYNGNVPEEDKQIKLYDKIERWWNSLSQSEKIDLWEENQTYYGDSLT